MKVSDYISNRLAFLGIRRCFTVTGGGAMHLNNSFGSNKLIECTYNHHEQASSMGAEGYARISKIPAVVVVTSGPGAINALNGVFGAYTDSVPMIIISGQVKRSTQVEGTGDRQLRQMGDQEARSREFIPAFVKYFDTVGGIDCIEKIDKAFEIATSGRKGPCWIEVPVDVQGKYIEALSHHIHDDYTKVVKEEKNDILENHIKRFFAMLGESKRPLLMIGTGIRLSNSEVQVLELAKKFAIPITTAWTHDICDNNNELFIGRPGTIGTRPGNFAVQACDLLIIIGSRLNIRQISYNWEKFAPNARKVMVDIDESELKKPNLSIDLKIKSDAKLFLNKCKEHEEQLMPKMSIDLMRENHKRWISSLQEVKNRYDAKYSDYLIEDPNGSINPYHLIFKISELLRENHQIVCGDATACIVPFQVMKLSEKQRMFSNSGCASMGYDLPAGIGAHLASQDENENCPTIIFGGDGSIMMNIQELETFRNLKGDVVLFILDNNGYLSIKQTQSNFFGTHYGASPESGLTFPDFGKISKAFGINTYEIENYQDLNEKIEGILLHQDSPRVCIIKLDQTQEFEPRIKSRLQNDTIVTPELDDMYPHLSSEEISNIKSLLIPKLP